MRRGGPVPGACRDLLGEPCGGGDACDAALGLGVVSRHALQGARGLRVLDVEGFPISSRWHVVHPSAKQLSPIARAFRTHLLKHAPREALKP